MSGLVSMLKPDLGKVLYLAIGALLVPKLIGRFR